MATYNEIYTEAEKLFDSVYAIQTNSTLKLINPTNTSVGDFWYNWTTNKNIYIDSNYFSLKNVVEACPEDRKIRYNPGDPKNVSAWEVVEYIRETIFKTQTAPINTSTLEEIKKEQVLFLTAVFMGGLKVLGVNTPKPKLGNYTSV